ncbi:hypothetical protein D3C73_860850 [compost metagenome]
MGPLFRVDVTNPGVAPPRQAEGGETEVRLDEGPCVGLVYIDVLAARRGVLDSGQGVDARVGVDVVGVDEFVDVGRQPLGRHAIRQAQAATEPGEDARHLGQLGGRQRVDDRFPGAIEAARGEGELAVVYASLDRQIVVQVILAEHLGGLEGVFHRIGSDANFGCPVDHRPVGRIGQVESEVDRGRL